MKHGQRRISSLKIQPKTPEELDKMRVAGRLAGGFRHTYGCGAAHAGSRAIVDRAMPAEGG